MKKITKDLLITLTVLILIPTLYANNCFIEAQKLMNLEPISKKVDEYTEKAEYIPFDEINKDFVNAVVATEDKRFFTRKGFDWIALARAVIVNVVSGQKREGGSTLSQQIAKNLYFQSSSRGIKEKIEEVAIMLQLEDAYSKEELFALYACMNYYGDGYWGLNSAAKGYYNLDQKELSLAKCAMLAGIPNAPGLMQLSTGYDLAKKRQEKVLNRMLDEQYISEEEYKQALTEEVDAYNKKTGFNPVLIF